MRTAHVARFVISLLTLWAGCVAPLTIVAAPTQQLAYVLTPFAGRSDSRSINSPRGLIWSDTGELYIIQDGFEGEPFAAQIDGFAVRVDTIIGGYAMTADVNGQIYISMKGRGYIGKMTGRAVTRWVGADLGIGFADGPPGLARFNAPAGIAIDANGNVIVADSGNHSIRRIDREATVTTVAGLGGVRGNEDGPRAEARFNSPNGVAVAADGTIYVADTGNHTIRKVAQDGTVMTFAGLAGSAGTQDGAITNARFNAPEAILLHGSGHLIVADTGNHVLRRISPSGVVETLAGNPGTPGFGDGRGSAARFSNPGNMIADKQGRIFVLDQMTGSVRVVTADGEVSTLVGAVQDGSPAVARFAAPLDVAIDRDGNLLIADAANGMIRRISRTGTTTTVAGQPGKLGVGSDDGSIETARFRNPTGVAAAGDGTIYVADSGNHTVRVISLDGRVSTLAGLAGSVGNADGMGAAARFNFPVGLALDASGNVLVADANNNAIRRITRAGVVTTVAGGAGVFFAPLDVAAGHDGSIYIADTSYSRIQRIAPDGGTPTTLLQGIAPRTVYVDRAGTVFFANHAEIYRLDSGGQVTRLGGTDTGGGGGTPLNDIRGLAVTDDGTLFVAGGSRSVWRMTPPAPFLRINSQPSEQVMSVGDTLVLAVGIEAYPPPSIQWFRDNVPLAGATRPRLVLSNLTPSQAGLYTARISNASGSFVTNPARISVTENPPPRLANLSILAKTPANGDPLIVGAVLVGGEELPLLVRAVGPSLMSFGVPAPASDPSFTVYQGEALFVTNDNWGGAEAVAARSALVGAFPLSSGASHDAAVAFQAMRGAYTVHIRNSAGPATVLAEFYDSSEMLGSDNATRLANLSTIVRLDDNTTPAIAGFVVKGGASKTVLIRGMGPSLVRFTGNRSLIEDPTLRLYRETALIADNDDWGGDVELAEVARRVGAFSFASDGSRDAALLITLPPGSYTAQLGGLDLTISGRSGLIEIYEIR